jgi:hypothetical protein
MSGEQQRTKPSQRGLPPDAAPGEAEIIDAFYEWVHENHPNPQRIGCPGRLALAELVVTETEFEDKYTLNHIGECAPCVDDLTELRLEFERMNKDSE